MTARFRWLLGLGAGGADETAADVVARLALRDAAPADRPALVLNMISSLDGRMTAAGHTALLANRADHEMFHALRSAGDAVLVGAGTVRAEGYGPMDQLAVVVSGSLELDPSLGLLRAPENRVVIVTDNRDGELAPCAASVGYLRVGDLGRDLGTALRELRAEHGVRAVVCEGGPRLNASLLPAGLVDELHLVLAPLLVGGPQPLTLVEGAGEEWAQAAELGWLLESGGYLFARYHLISAGS